MTDFHGHQLLQMHAVTARRAVARRAMTATPLLEMAAAQRVRSKTATLVPACLQRAQVCSSVPAFFCPVPAVSLNVKGVSPSSRPPSFLTPYAQSTRQILMCPHPILAMCGDGIKVGAEACDDGNTDNGDGCSSTCAVEAGYVCSGSAPSTCSSV